MATQSKKQTNPGEGDRDADRRYRKKARLFAKSGKVKEAARRARKSSRPSDKEAEKSARARARELDPDVHRNYDQPVKEDDK